MLSENIGTNGAGKLSLPVEKADVINNVISFIKIHLLSLRQYKNIKDEDELTQKLVMILNREIILFFFHFQYITRRNNKKATVDIGTITKDDYIKIDTVTYSNDETFFSIEAKRLDSGLPKNREKEYVVGRHADGKYKDTGGIERFKKKLHGDTLNFAGLLGYMQSDSFDIWIGNINKWIDEQLAKPNSKNILWKKEDGLLEEYKDKYIREYVSINERIDKTNIKIFHIWIDMTN